MKLLSNELPMLWSICSNRKPDHARPSSLCFQAGKNRKRYFWILFLAFSQHQGLADSPAPQDVFSVRITSEKWVHTHLQVGMTREEVLKLVGRPSFEDTGSTGDWIMSYLFHEWHKKKHIRVIIIEHKG